MKRPAVFFDRDNTLIACDEYLGDATKVELVEGAAAAVARARELGYATVVISNQSGVARGYFSEAAVHAVNERLDEMLKEANPKAIIDRHEFCPFHPDASIEKYRSESPRRKPAPGMIHAAAEALALDLSRSWVIGDAPRDIEAGHAAGCRTIFFTGPALKASPAALAEKKVEPDYVCSTLGEALEFIERHSPRPPAAEVEKQASAPVEQKQPAIDLLTHSTPHPSPTIPAARDSAGARGEGARLESLAEQILHELRRAREQPVADFSVSKLLAGVVQVIVLFVLFLAFLARGEMGGLVALLLFALTLQAMCIALLIMSRQK
jgi:D-glycero-D-manno-heptose 1,7-bisphosphate phosphatase